MRESAHTLLPRKTERNKGKYLVAVGAQADGYKKGGGATLRLAVAVYGQPHSLFHEVPFHIQMPPYPIPPGPKSAYSTDPEAVIASGLLPVI